MGFWRKTALVGLVWLTAGSTLLAGFPGYRCACPVEDPKPPRPERQSRTAASPPAPCGCCCSAAAGKCCCCQSRREPASGPSHGPGFGKAPRPNDYWALPGCERTLVRADFAVVTSAKVTPETDRAAGLPAAAVVAEPGPLPVRAGNGLTGHPFQAPPPADLPIAFQRLLI